MRTQNEQATLFATLHIKRNPLILFNVWDAGSAKAIEASGAQAIATGSKSVALAHGFEDGQTLPLALVVTNLQRIVRSVTLPVTLDFEGGYAETVEDLKETVGQVIKAGAVGINFEDQIVGGSGLYTIGAQAARISAIREVAGQMGVSLFINARTDIFLKMRPNPPGAEAINEAIQRAVAYAEAGASGLFIPGLADLDQIRTVCEQSPLPVNVMMLPGMPTPKQLVEVGVARISYGPAPYLQMMKGLEAAGRAALSLE
jgi:2-methylisocitrate lyase-like PEP mutase family enzyme